MLGEFDLICGPSSKYGMRKEVVFREKNEGAIRKRAGACDGMRHVDTIALQKVESECRSKQLPFKHCINSNSGDIIVYEILEQPI